MNPTRRPHARLPARGPARLQRDGRRSAPRGTARGGAATVDGARIVAADREPQNWLAHGRTYDEQRYSPLDQINDGNVAKLGLAWCFDTGTTRGLEATPIVVDGVMYVTGPGAWSGARRGDGPRAVEVRPRGAARLGPLPVLRRRQPRRRGLEGRGLRRHDRRPPRRARREDRHQALGSQHHRPQQALHHHRRAARREGQGADRQRRRRTRRARLRLGLRRRDRQARLALLHRARQSEGRLRAPRARARPRRPGTASGGAAAAAARSGTRWPTTRSSTCSTSAPATARPGRATSARRAAATTCTSRRSSRSTRTPGGSSGTTRPRPARPGTTPRRSTSSSPTSRSAGKPRKVLMQAPKNGFFYVLDRATGELLSAEKFAPVTWASHVDLEDRPPGRDRDRELQPRDAPDRAGAARRAQLAPDGVQSEDRARLHPGHAADVPLLAVGRTSRRPASSRAATCSGTPASTGTQAARHDRWL